MASPLTIPEHDNAAVVFNGEDIAAEFKLVANCFPINAAGYQRRQLVQHIGVALIAKLFSPFFE